MNEEREKIKIRKYYQERIANLTSERRSEAQKAAFQELKELTKPFSRILSFSSLADEVSLWHLNYYLAGTGRLVLPRIDGGHLVPYYVDDPDTQLIRGPYQIEEPDPSRCHAVDLDKIDLIIVPGVVFDQEGGRIGRGKGFYDRLLASVNLTYKIGVGFKEQLYPTKLPQEPFDRPVSRVCLY